MSVRSIEHSPEPDDEQPFEDDRRKQYDPDLIMYNMDDIAHQDFQLSTASNPSSA